MSSGGGKTYLDANTYLRQTWRLAQAVYASGWRPDVLAGLWRGGAAPAAAVHEYLSYRGWEMRHFPLKCSSYGGIGDNSGGVSVDLQAVRGMVEAGDRVLVVDDVFDTGLTAQAVRRALSALGAEVRVACVHWKPGKNKTDGRPDYHAVEDGDGWIVFPHELCGLSPEEVGLKDPGFAIGPRA